MCNENAHCEGKLGFGVVLYATDAEMNENILLNLVDKFNKPRRYSLSEVRAENQI